MMEVYCLNHWIKDKDCHNEMLQLSCKDIASLIMEPNSTTCTI